MAEYAFPKRKGRSQLIKNAAKAGRKLALLRLLFPERTLKLEMPQHDKPGEGWDPLCHSMQGQTLCLMDWELQFPGPKLFCIQYGCESGLERERTNLSKNQRLFPICDLEGAPHWCTVAGYKCAKCKCTCNVNKVGPLCSIPESMQNECPCNPKCSGFGSILASLEPLLT